MLGSQADDGLSLESIMADLGVSAEELLANAEQSARGAGKPPIALEIYETRPLTAEDIQKVNSAAVGVSDTKALKKLRDRHHLAAELMAKGYKDVEIAGITGYSQSRLSILKNDPAFAELVETKRAVVRVTFTDTVEKMKAFTDDAIETLQERLEDTPDTFTNTQLIEAVKTIGDRAGFAPVQKSIAVQIPLDNSKLGAIKAKVKERQIGQVKQITQEAVDATYEIVPHCGGDSVGEADRPAGAVLEITQTEGE